MYQKPVRCFSPMGTDYSVLLTGFEPFGGHKTNISQIVVLAMAGSRTLTCPWTGSPLRVHVETDVLSVDSKGAQRTSERIHQGERWDAILHVGLCDACEVPRIERLAQDKLHMRLPDNAGRQVLGATIDDAGVRGCWVDPTVWVSERFPSTYTISVDAGAYLCNETYHATLKALCEVEASTPLPSPALFLHLPGENHLQISEAEDFVMTCLAHLLRPYPVDPVHVVAAAVGQPEGYLVTRRSLDETEGGCWEFPGGKCEVGENWKQATAREIREELELEVKPFHPLGSWYRVRGSDAFVIHLVSCTLEDAVEPSLSVHDAYEWISASGDASLSWAGRDGEMNAFLQKHFKPMLPTHHHHSSNAHR